MTADTEAESETHLLAAVAAVARRRLARADRWRRQRPFLGGILLMLGGLVTGYVSGGYALNLLLIGGAFTSIGLVVSLLMFLSGVAALAMPEESAAIGVIGTAMSLLSLLTAIGGLLVGLLLGIHGGVACWAWKPNDAEADPDDTSSP